MPANKLQIPDGVRDYAGTEAYMKREIEQELRCLFRVAGFEEIETPVFEYDSIFLGEIGNLRQENMLRFFDIDGKTLALRPDFTMPAARLVSARKGEFSLPVRVFYIGSAFGFQYNYGLRQRQFSQAGAELVGEGSTRADAEMLILAAHCLEGIGISDYVLDLGNVGVFGGLVQEAGLSNEQAKLLHQCIDGKLIPELQKHARDMGLHEDMAEAFISLASMYGKQGILDKAEKLYPYDLCRKAIGDIRGILEQLNGSSLSDKITIDLGLLPDMNYYTGTVFRGMVDGVSYQLLSGGRYDNVFGQFGQPLPATGFAMGIDWAIEAVEKQRGCPENICYALIGASRGHEHKSLNLAWEYRKQGKQVITSFAPDRAAIINEAESKGIGRAIFISGDGQEEIDIRGADK